MQIIQAFQVFRLLENIDQLLDIILQQDVRAFLLRITSNLPRSGYAPLLFPDPLPTWPVLLYKTLVPCTSVNTTLFPLSETSFYLIFANVGGCHGSLCSALTMCALATIIGEPPMGDEDDGTCVSSSFKPPKDRH